MMRKLNDELYYVGVNDHELDLFESQYIVPNGMAYNSYIIKDELIAIMDSVEARFFDEWISNIKQVLGDQKPNFLIVQHMEPDHSANIMRFLEVYPDTFVIGNAKTFKMMEQFFHALPKHKLVVNDLDTLNLGKHTLTFYFAPMVHWPEVMFTYDDVEKTLFTADAFGKFGALDVEEEWACEARRYYFGIVGKYGPQVQAILKKASKLDIQRICALHGPVLDKDIPYYVNLYNIWSSYCSEKDGVAIFYASVYGHTKEACEILAKKLEAKGVKVAIEDLARSDIAEDVEDAFKYNRIVLATTTYNAGIFPFMNIFLDDLIERNFQNKVIGIIENGTWFPQAKKVIQDKLSKSKNLVFLPSVTINSSLDEKSREELETLANSLLEAKEPIQYEPPKVEVEEKKKGYVCKVCGYVYEGDELPEDFVCPNCKQGRDAFEKL